MAYIKGTNRNDNLKGTSDTDSIFGLDGDDTIDPGTGVNDFVDGGPGYDYLILNYVSVTGPYSFSVRNVERINFQGSNTGDNISLNGTTDDLYGNGGNDTLDAGSEDDLLDGGSGDDNLIGGSGEDTLFGESDNDILRGGEDNDFLDGGTGNDDLNGEDGRDYLLGGDNNDTLDGGSEDYEKDTLIGGLGDDRYVLDFSGVIGIHPWNQSAVIDEIVEYRGRGDDTVLVTNATYSVTLLDYVSGNYTLGANLENLTIAESALEFYGYGNELDNELSGNSKRNYLSGKAGNDTLNGNDDDDTLIGGQGDDLLDGGQGIDTANYSSSTSNVTVNLLGGTASDGFGGTDRLLGIEQVLGSGFNDLIFGGDGDDTLEGGDGNDNMRGRGGDDLVDGGIGDDFLHGDAGNDTMFGGSDNDVLYGDTGNDVLRGDDGIDTLIGTGGNVANPGLGEIDTLTGGLGLDKFVLGTRENTQIFYDDGNTSTSGSNDYALITDFAKDTDLILIRGSLDDYQLVTGFLSGVGSIADTSIYLIKPTGEPNELIAIVEDVTGLTNSDFVQLI